MINILTEKDLITLDLRTKQIRVLKDVKKHGEIEFINLSSGDVEGYEYLFNEDMDLFLDTLKEDLKSFLNYELKGGYFEK